jgi:excisionase family DNA binding protein
MEFDRYVSPKDLAATLNVKLSTVYSWVKKGLLPGIKVRRTVRIKEKDIHKFLEKKEREAQRRVFRA